METELNFEPTINVVSPSTDYEAKFIKVGKKKGFQKKNARLKSKNIGHWTQLEKQLYYVFLKSYRENFIKKELRRTDKIFKEMAKFIKTRAADQCRSHHQKMQKKHETIDNILSSLLQFQTNKSYPEILKLFQSEHHPNLLICSQTPNSQPRILVSSVSQPLLSPLLTYDQLQQQQLSLNSYDQLFSDEPSNIDRQLLM